MSGAHDRAGPGAAPWALAAALAAAAAAPSLAAAQTLADQEARLIELHALLLALPPLAPPAALAPGRLSAGIELITIPAIDGTTGSRRQITASDRTPVFPRPRVLAGLPSAGSLRLFAGAAYIPPVRVNGVSTHHAAAEAGVALARGPLAAGARLHGTIAASRSPVTDPATRDRLDTRGWGADGSVGLALPSLAGVALTPYAGGGVVGTHGRFRVTTDGAVLTARHTGPAYHAGVRAGWRRLEGVAAWNAYPGRLRHLSFRVAAIF